MLGVSILTNIFLDRAKGIVKIGRKGTSLVDSPVNLPHFSPLAFHSVGTSFIVQGQSYPHAERSSLFLL